MLTSRVHSRWLPVVALVTVFAGTTTWWALRSEPARGPIAASAEGATPNACPTASSLAPEGCTPPVGDVEAESVIATVTAPRIVARAAPRSDARAVASWPRRSPEGIPQVFLLTARTNQDLTLEGPDGETWYEALLPVRPNGTRGFLPTRAVSIDTTPYRLEIDRSRFRLTVWKGAEVVHRMPIGLGTGKTPTPVGRFYLTSLLRPPNPDTIYGTYAYGLSGYSEVLTDWEGGGVVGLHGTNDPSSIGKRSSHGCIRLHNEDIEKLVPLLPLGTPIEIT